ncbi:unnamed protein product [Notodromas monacha]|uniref:Uncharacterized protein n=1 Tax=Notodromas monacha TaxID=399045 RepID=A0A7R9C245_9CRUS|nr:unnamed protein product [Notodromas monacha]CAG0924700.1 unnamed protein product [Notodromas monacha]
MCCELEALKKRKAGLEEEARALSSPAERLLQLYEREDELLDRMFGGKYGSEREFQLEKELEDLTFVRAKIIEVNKGWRQAKLMVDYSALQINRGLELWRNILQIHMDEEQGKEGATRDGMKETVQKAEEYFSAASQNLESAQQYVEMEFPYCDREDLTVFNQALIYMSDDAEERDRATHAADVYVTIHHRSLALSQWLKQAIEAYFTKDLHQINDRIKTKTLALRRERVYLIKAKVSEFHLYTSSS